MASLSIVNTDPYLAYMGVGIFGSQDTDTVAHVFDPTKRSRVLLLSALNIAGWIPGVNIISGLFQVYYGIARCDSPDDSIFFVARGFLQITQMGVLLAPVDIAITLVRIVRECKRL